MLALESGRGCCLTGLRFLPRWVPWALTCSTGSGEPAGPLPAGAAGVARPGGDRPRASAVGSPVDGPVGGQRQLREARPSWAGLSGCHQVSWAQARLSPDMPHRGATPLPSPSTHLPGWRGPKPYRSHISQSGQGYPGVPPEGLAPWEGTSGSLRKPSPSPAL